MRKEKGQIWRGRRLNKGKGTEGRGKENGQIWRGRRLNEGLGTEGNEEGKGTDMERETAQ